MSLPHLSLQRFSFWFCQHWKAIVLSVVLLLVAAPFIVLHLLVWMVERHEPSLVGYERVTYHQPDGAPLAAYLRRAQNPLVTIIFVHGTPASGSAFRWQMKSAFPDADLLTYDRPGFGDSPGNLSKANLQYQSTVLVDLVEKSRTPKVILVGHSYGGPLVLKAAAMEPTRVAGVAMIGGSVSPQEEHPWPIQYVGAWPIISFLLPSVVSSFNEELLHLKADLVDLDGELPKIKCPVLMIEGAEDELVPLANVPYLKRRFEELGMRSQFQERIFPHYNHFMMWEHPLETNRVLEEFVGGIIMGR